MSYISKILVDDEVYKLLQKYSPRIVKLQHLPVSS